MLALLLFALDITATPLPSRMAPTKDQTAWLVYACSARAESVDSRMVEAALVERGVAVLPAPMALEMISRRNAERWQSRLIRIGGLVLAGATSVTAGGLVSASTRTIAGLALATSAAPEISRGLRATLPAFDPGLLPPARVEIASNGGCWRGVVLAAARRGKVPKPISMSLPTTTVSSAAAVGELILTTRRSPGAEVSAVPVEVVWLVRKEHY